MGSCWYRHRGTVASTITLMKVEIWADTYRDWGSMQSLGQQVGVFITGAAQFIEKLGFVSHKVATAFIAVVVVSFALTTLDSATRLLRFNISEIGETLRLRILDNRFIRTHRSYIVNTDKITAYTKYDIEIDTIEIPIGESYKNGLMEKLNVG